MQQHFTWFHATPFICFKHVSLAPLKVPTFSLPLTWLPLTYQVTCVKSAGQQLIYSWAPVQREKMYKHADTRSIPIKRVLASLLILTVKITTGIDNEIYNTFFSSSITWPTYFVYSHNIATFKRHLLWIWLMLLFHSNDDDDAMFFIIIYCVQ